MATWAGIPLELKHGIIAYLLPPINDGYVIDGIAWADDIGKAGVSFVQGLEPYLLVNKAFSKAMQLPLEQHVRDLRAFRENVLGKGFGARKQLGTMNDEFDALAELAFLEEQWHSYVDLIEFTNARRRYVLRILQHIRGRARGSWQSLPKQIRTRILEFVLPEIRIPFGEPNIVLEQAEVGAVGLQSVHTTLAGLAVRDVSLHQVLTHFQNVRRHLERLHFVSKQFSWDVYLAMDDKIKKAWLEYRRLQESEGWSLELRQNVAYKWTRESLKLTDYVSIDFDGPLVACGCHSLDEDEVVDWKLQVQGLLKERTKFSSA